MALWQVMEEWLFLMYEKHGPNFRFHTGLLQRDLRIDGAEASRMVQAYLAAQRRPDSDAMFTLKREGRTSASTWSVGERAADARVMNKTLFKDVCVKVKRAYEPDMKRIASRGKPAARRAAERKIEVVVGNMLPIIAEALDSYFDDGDDEE